MFINNPLPVLCGCGCGKPTAIATYTRREDGTIKGQPLRFLPYHHLRLKGEKHAAWKGGRSLSSGYIYVYAPDHPRMTKSTKRIGEHVLIAEKALGKFLPPRAEVHHVNEIKSDNRNNNLVICPSPAYHNLLHSRMNALKGCGNPNFRQCYICKLWDDPRKLKQHAGGNFHHTCQNQDQQIRYYKNRQAKE